MVPDDEYRWAAQSSQLGCWEFNMSSGILSLNRVMTQLWDTIGDKGCVQHFSHQAIEGDFMAAVHPDDLAILPALSEAVLRTGTRSETLYRLLWRNGSTLYIRACTELVSNADGSQSLIGTCMDATPLFMNWSREGERQGSFGIIRTGVVKPGALTAELLDVQDRGEASWVREGHWSLGKVIGRGATGTVHMGMIEDTGRLIAVKVIEMHHHARSGASGSEQAHHHHREVQMMRSLRHPNLVAFLGSASRGNELFILQEWVPGGSISALLSSFGHLNTKVVRRYARQVLHGLAYLHANAIVHRDLKCANLLVDAGGNVKIADFGTSAVVSQCRGDHGQSRLMGTPGTPIYMAPELMFQLEGNQGLPVDIWAFGAAVLEMATAQPPWRITGPEGMPGIDYLRCLVARERAPALPLDLDATLRSLLTQCFCWRSGDRPTCSALLVHDFLRPGNFKLKCIDGASQSRDTSAWGGSVRSSLCLSDTSSVIGGSSGSGSSSGSSGSSSSGGSSSGSGSGAAGGGSSSGGGSSGSGGSGSGGSGSGGSGSSSSVCLSNTSSVSGGGSGSGSGGGSGGGSGSGSGSSGGSGSGSGGRPSTSAGSDSSARARHEAAEAADGGGADTGAHCTVMRCAAKPALQVEPAAGLEARGRCGSARPSAQPSDHDHWQAAGLARVRQRSPYPCADRSDCCLDDVTVQLLVNMQHAPSRGVSEPSNLVAGRQLSALRPWKQNPHGAANAEQFH